VTTHRFSHLSYGSRDAVDWEQQEWHINAVLVPLDTAYDALAQATQVLQINHISFTPWWMGSDTFDFAESAGLGGIKIFPWIYMQTHSLNGQLLIEPRQDFLRYHALDLRPDGVYVHPLDGTAVLTIQVEARA
jgi:hypothetical protein